MEQTQIYAYPFNPDYDYKMIQELIDLDKERNQDLTSGNGFIVAEPMSSIKKDLKNPEGLFSPKFGQTLGDLNPFMDRYKCQCGALRSRINNGIICQNCKQPVRYVDDNFGYFGWIPINDPCCIIHPILYKQIESLMGQGHQKTSKLQNIINYVDKKSKDGFSIERGNLPKNEPWFGKGMMEFKEHFDEIMEYYIKKYPKKREYYDIIMQNREKVFAHSIPVFTSLLRPTETKDGAMFYEPINAIYTMINKHRSIVNRRKTRFDRQAKLINQSLYVIQTEYNKLYDSILDILSGKKGELRSLLAGRYNFSTRAVIVQNPSLRIDQVTLPYISLCIILEQRIINILHRMYNLSYNDAHDIWYQATLEPDDRVKDIINAIIKSYPQGLPVIINRNPTIAYGSILQMFCVGMTDTFTIGIPLRILKSMAADFDGDEFNVFTIINDAFFEKAFEVFNPRNAFQISRNDGMFNMDVCIQRDTIINANTLMWLGRDQYTQEELDEIKAILASS